MRSSVARSNGVQASERLKYLLGECIPMPSLRFGRALSLVVLSLLISTSFLALIANPVQASPDEWGVDWLDGFHCRKLHEIGPSAGAGTGYDVGIKVYNGTGTDGTEIVAGIEYGKVYINETRWKFDDIRFTASDKLTLLPFWKENYTANVSANFWVKISANLNTTLTTIYVYWDNQYAVDGSCGEATFEFYDHFANHIWQKDGVILPIATNDWHFTEPTVLYETGRQILTSGIGPVFKLWYRAQELSGGTYYGYLRYCESENGIDWSSSNTLFTAPADASGSALSLPSISHIGNYYYLYVHRNSVPAPLNTMDCYRSSNGMTGWALIGSDTIHSGAGTWDNYILGNVFVWKEGATWYCIYEADSLASPNLWRCGLQTSTDGLSWTIYGTNALIGNASCSFGGPCVQKIGSTYYVWGQESRDLTHWAITRWSSNDLHTWVRANGYEPIFPATLAIEHTLMVDPYLVYARGNIWMYYSAVTDAYHWNGLSLARSGIPFDQLVQTQEIQAYNKTLNWNGTTNLGSDSMNYVNVTNSIATIHGENYPPWGAIGMNSKKQNLDIGMSVRFNGSFHTPSGTFEATNFWIRDSATHVSQGIYLSWTAAPHNYYGVYDGTTNQVTTNIDNRLSTWDLTWISGKTAVYQYGVEKLNSPLTTNVPATTPMCISFEAWGSTHHMDIDYTFVRPYIASEPAHGGWSDLCVYSYSGIPIPPTPGGYSNENVLWALFALTIIIMCVGVIYHKLY